jgi:hypothetical protein
MTISKKTVGLTIGLCGVVIAGCLFANGWMIGLGLLAVSGYLAKKAWGIRQQFFGPPQGHALRRADLTDVTGPTLGHYYVHADGQNIATVAAGVYCQPPFDERGIPLVDYGPGVGKHYNTCTISQYALEHWERWCQTRDPVMRDKFLQLADWLVENLEDGKWYCRFDDLLRGQRNPWVSAMDQGQGMSVLLRAWQCSGAGKYRIAAEQALALFEVPVAQGGVAIPTPAGTWFEEYPNATAPDHVLNGHVWALFGIWDMHRATQNATARRLFDEGVAVLKANLAAYDNGYWVWYDLRPRSFLVDGYYMCFQIDQVRVLHEITGDPVWAGTVRRWEGYRSSVWSSVRVVARTLAVRLGRGA